MKVFVAMSGGIDSSVCLYLLKQQGFNVVGLTLMLDNYYDNPIIRSKLLCNRFGVEHIVLDCRDIFKQDIIDDFNKKISLGITPVPCVSCNRKIKFGYLIDFCRNNDAKLATGHYAKIMDYNNTNDYEKCIFKAKDTLKDQTHFLCDIKRDVLDDIIFPLGDILKSEVFRIAKNNNLLQVDDYKESQEVCFFNDKTYAEYVKSLNFNEKKGDIIHILTGKKIGEHDGLLKYTIGQRQGLGIAWREPLYVVKKDGKRNILFVGEENCLYNDELTVKNMNILAGDFLKKEIFECEVCLRDKTPIMSAVVEKKQDGFANIKLKTKARAITAGQMCAFYDKDRLIGGGEIL